jgi:hypothetical protein
MSMSGLAAVESGALPVIVPLLTWVYVAAVFVAIELIELARAAARCRSLGVRRGLFLYDVSQWSRNFTFGMAYAFTLAFVQKFSAASVPAGARAAQEIVLAGGQ